MCSYCSCQVQKKKKVFIQLCHGSLECWKCERCQNVLITMTYSTWRQERIMLMYWCKGSYNSPFHLKNKTKHTNKKLHDNIRKHTILERGSILLSSKPSDMFQELSVHQIAFQSILGGKKNQKRKRKEAKIRCLISISWFLLLPWGENGCAVQVLGWAAKVLWANPAAADLGNSTLPYWYQVHGMLELTVPTWLYLQHATNSGNGNIIVVARQW